MEQILKHINKIIILICLLCFSGLFISCNSKDDVPVTLLQMDENRETRLARISIEGFDSITFRIYEDVEPELVDNFFKLCNDGYYNGTDFFNVINGYLIMGGKTASGKSSGFSGTFSELYPLYGALCFNLNSENTCELNNFYVIGSNSGNINNIKELLEYRSYDFRDYLKFGYDTELTSEEMGYYDQYGGAPWLQGHTVVIGQAYDGLDVIDRIFEAHAEDSSLQFKITCIETY